MDSDTLRKILKLAMAEDDGDAVKEITQNAILAGWPIKELTDLHYNIIVFLITPNRKRLGRKKDPRTDRVNRLMNLACSVKSKITKKSFSYTWEEYADNKTRPKILEKDDIHLCAGILQFNLKYNLAPEIGNVLHQFKLTEDDLNSLLVS